MLLVASTSGYSQTKGNFILPDKQTYGYLNCHMSDRGQWTAYALSRDGHHYHDLLGGDSIFSSWAMAGIEGGTRDAYICRRHDNKGYLMVTTDMHNGATKRLKKLDTWHNYGINLLRSDDLIHWTSTTFDFRKWQPNVTRVWAPQIIWDADYQWPDGRRGGYMIYYSMLDPDREQYDRMYYSYADDDFTTITRPQLLFDWGYATIDADINWIEADGQFHMMIKKEGGTPGIFTTSSTSLTGPWPEPDASRYVDFEGRKKCEGPSAFQLRGGQWQIGYIEYSSRPRHYRLCDADPTLTHFSNPRDIEGVTGSQHGSFLRLTKAEYKRLQKWSDSQGPKLVALSFDDGPNTTTTVQMLDVLKKHNVKASFFVIGQHINAESAKVMQRAHKEGHDIENHSLTHSFMNQLSADSIQSEIAQTSALVKQYVGERPQFFRPPYIAVNQTMFASISLPFICGEGCNDWEADVTTDQRVDKMLASSRDGLIYLLHDFEGNDNTVEAVDRIIPILKKKGYKFVTVRELFKRKKITPAGGILYTDILHAQPWQ